MLFHSNILKLNENTTSRDVCSCVFVLSTFSKHMLCLVKGCCPGKAGHSYHFTWEFMGNAQWHTATSLHKLCHGYSTMPNFLVLTTATVVAVICNKDGGPLPLSSGEEDAFVCVKQEPWEKIVTCSAT